MLVHRTFSIIGGRRRNRFAAVAMVLASLGWALPVFAQMPTTMLSAVYPPSGQAGTDVEVQIAGENLDDALSLQFSHQGITSQPKMIPADEFRKEPVPMENQFTVKIAPDVPPGLYEVRAAGRFGLSNPRAFVVDDLKQVKREGQPNSRENAMPVEVGSTIVAQMTVQQVEHYAVELKAGDRVLIDCWGQRIDSRIDPVVTLYDPNGRIVRRARQAEPRDTAIQWEVKQSGRFVVAVYDFLYRGGNEHAYRLSIRKAPYLDFIFPPVGEPGSNKSYVLYGRNLPNGQPADGLKVRGVPLQKTTVQIALPSDPSSLNHLPMTGAMESYQAAACGFTYRLQGPEGVSNAVTIHFSDAPVQIEQEPANNDPAKAQKVTVPCEYVGQFYPERDQDWVAFDAKKDEVLWINVISQRLGTMADPVLVIEQVTKDAKGVEQVKQIAKVDDAPYTAPPNNQPDLFSLQTDDPNYRLVADQDATYRIRLQDLYNNPANDPRLVYRLVIQKESPDFQLVAYTEPEKDARNQIKPTSCVLRRGGTAAVKLNLARQYGFDGVVDVSVEGLPQGVSCLGAKLGGTVNEGYLVFEAAENAPDWAGPIRILGRAEAEGKTVTREARSGTLLWPVMQNQPAESRMARNVTLSVVTAETAPVVLKAGDGQVIETSLGGKVEIPFQVTKREPIKGDLKVAVIDLPKDINRQDVTIKGDTGKAKLYLRTANVPVGSYTFYFLGTSKFSYKRNQEAVTEAKAELDRANALKKQYDDQLKAGQQKAVEAAKLVTTAANELKTAQQALDAVKKQTADLTKQVTEAETQLAAAKKALEQAKDDKAKADAVAKAEKTVADLKPKLAEAATKQAAAEGALKTAEQKNLAAQQTKKTDDDAVKNLTEMQKKADAFTKAADAKFKAETNRNKTADINLQVVSSPVVLKVAPHPLKINAPSTLGKLKPEQSLELPVSIERLYGFAEKVDVDLTLPSGTKGLSVKKATIDKNKTDAKLTVQAAKDASPGQYPATLQLRLQFNNVSLVATQPITIEVEKPEPLAAK